MPVEPPVVSPRTLAEAYAILAGAPHRPVAGGTDLLVQLTGEIGPAPERVIDLWRVDELRGIRVGDGALELGALTTYTQIRRSDDVRDARAVAGRPRPRRSAPRRSRTAARSAAT